MPPLYAKDYKEKKASKVQLDDLTVFSETRLKVVKLLQQGF
jgi:hypothetical protein